MNKPQLAGAAEVLRCSQKDEEYMHYMRSLISDLTQKCLGIPFWIKWKDFINIFSDFIFLSLTTLSGFQTLGEEYVNIIQVNETLRSIPSRWKRLLDVSLHTFGYYFLLRFQRWLENQISVLSRSVSKSDGDSLEEKLLIFFQLVLKTLTIIQRFHLIAFYFAGTYYTIAKRLTGIKYVVIRRWLTHPAYQRPYKMLGWIAASQLCLSLILTIYSKRITNLFTYVNKEESKSTGSAGIVPAKCQCSLCLEKRNESTATPCGHLFCWSCITSWMQNKEECPLCRETFAPSKLLYLQNYY